ncbi:MAG: outer membrane beta-barrel protein [Endomicrobia bacterium]|nr:outer membrane beta-barrel protein [Endomicrobiia bacterium]
MIKKLAFSFLFAVFYSGFAFSDGVRPYAGFKGAVSVVQSGFDLGEYRWVPNPFDNGYSRIRYDESTGFIFSGAAALGVKFNSMRFEAEYTYRAPAEQQYDYFPDVRQESGTVLLNFLYDFASSQKFHFYAGGGLGATFVKNDVKYEGVKKKTSFALGVDLGVSFEVARRLNLDTGLKLTYLGNMYLKNTDYFMTAADLYLGLRYTI